MSAPQRYSRVGFAQEMKPLSDNETVFFLAQRWSHHVSAHSDDSTAQEAVAAILRITEETHEDSYWKPLIFSDEQEDDAPAPLTLSD